MSLSAAFAASLFISALDFISVSVLRFRDEEDTFPVVVIRFHFGFLVVLGVEPVKV